MAVYHRFSFIITVPLLAATCISLAGSILAAQKPVATEQSPSVLGIISDFDTGEITSSFGYGWITSTDQLAGGSSAASMAIVPDGANATPAALSASGTIAPGLLFAWSGVTFMPGVRPMQSTNLSAAKALSFWAKGDGKTYHILVFAQSRGQMPIMKDFVAGAEWKEYTFPIASFDDIDGHDVMGIAFTSGPEAGAYKFRIDQVALQ